ncbi:MAG: sulfur oxidation c-type cytochrome SoxX [Betaproteobacteria bacterium]
MRPWAAPLGALACALLGTAAAQNLPPASGSTAGSVERGRLLLANRSESGCVLCHVVAGLPAGGELGPSLVGIAQRSTAEQLRKRIADARAFNPATIMPVYFSTEGLHGVAAAYRGQTVLSAQGLDDIVAYLLSPAP